MEHLACGKRRNTFAFCFVVKAPNSGYVHTSILVLLSFWKRQSSNEAVSMANIPLFLIFHYFSCFHAAVCIFRSLYYTFSLTLLQNCCQRRSMCAYPKTCYIKVCHNGQQEACFLLRPEVLSFISGRQRSHRGATILLKLTIVKKIGGLLQIFFKCTVNMSKECC